MRHFIENCNDNGFKYLRFTIVDCLSNVDGLTDDEIDDPLLKKEKYLLDKKISHATSCLHSKHDLNRTKRCESEKLNR